MRTLVFWYGITILILGFRNVFMSWLDGYNSSTLERQLPILCTSSDCRTDFLVDFLNCFELPEFGTVQKIVTYLLSPRVLQG